MNLHPLLRLVDERREEAGRLLACGAEEAARTSQLRADELEERLREYEREQLIGRRSAERLSEHAWLEIAHPEHAGHRPGDPLSLDPDDPVPGCSCLRYLIFARDIPPGGGRRDPGARSRPRSPRSRRATPSAPADPAEGRRCQRALPRLARPAGRRDTVGHQADAVPPATAPLPVEEARSTSILDVARRLGLGDPERRGSEYVVRCPIHDDHDPSLRLNPEKDPPGGVWRCWPCVDGGDAIDLVEAAHGLKFPDAVRWIAAGGRR